MARSVLIVCLGLCAVAPGVARAQRGGSFQKRARPTLEWALKELARVEGMAGSCANGPAMRQRLVRVRRHLGYLLPRRATATPAPGRVAAVAVRPMAAGNFGRLMGAIRGQRFSQGKLRAIHQAAARKYFSCRQASILVRAMSLVSYKLQVLRLLRRRITDPRNKATILGAFPLATDRLKARRILAGVR